MTIHEIVRAAAQQHMTYGEYVQRFCPPEKPAEPEKPVRICQRCGDDISTRSRAAKYCVDCADRTHREWRKTHKRGKESEA